MRTQETAVFYDLTNLFHNGHSPTPTGIGRVDLRYAKHILDTWDDRCHFVVQWNKRFRVVPGSLARRLVIQLERRWFQETRTDDAAMLSILDELQENLFVREPDSVPVLHTLTRSDIDFLFHMNFEHRFTYITDMEISEYLSREYHWIDNLQYSTKILFLWIISSYRWIFASAVVVSKIMYRLFSSDEPDGQAKDSEPPHAKPREIHEAVEIPSLLAARNFYVNISQIFDVDKAEMFSERYGWRSIFLFYDLLPISLPEYFPFSEFGKHDERLRQCCNHDVDIIVISETVRGELLDYAGDAPALGDRVHVARIGVEPKYIETAGRLAGDAADGAYFVILGTIEPRKNHTLLLNVWRDLEARGMDPLPTLYVVGQRGWEIGNVVNLLERTRVRHAVVELNQAPDDQIMALLKGARALLFPSFGEGWGMPLVEALTLGVPVICSDIPVFHEAGQDVPDYVHPLDGLGWARAIEDYAGTDSEARAAQCRRIEAFEPPRWADHFAVIDRLLNKPVGPANQERKRHLQHPA